MKMKNFYKRCLATLLTVAMATLAHAVKVRFDVTVPDGTQKVYLIGSTNALGNWGANENRALPMNATNATQWTLTVELQPNTAYQYMFLCGPNWKYEQSPNASTPFTTGTQDETGDNHRINTVTGWSAIPPKVTTVTFNVTVPASTQEVYLAGGDNDNATDMDELGNWEVPKGRCVKMLKTGEGTFSVTLDLTPDQTYYYKYLCGAAWDYEQSAADAFAVSTASAQVTHDVVNSWKGVPVPPSSPQNYLKRTGNQITDAQGNNFVMRAIGLGNYMVWEPYMWKVTDYAKAGIMQDIVGRMSLALEPTDLQAFIDGYMANYITKDDVDSLKKWGFNAIRLPMHYNLFIATDADDNTFIEKGFEMTEQLRQWCAANEMYLVLDLHAAPGGQGNDHAISDSRSPGLWDGNSDGTARQYQDKTVLLWQELARRFGDKEWMGGYDLLNETNYYTGDNLNLLDLYKRCTKVIRLHDRHSIIYLEGNGFANDFTSIAPELWGADWDDNVAFSCHKYWAKHDGFAGEDLRTKHNVPLWLGETGENANEWFYQTVKLAESRNIGWAWWAHKKIDNISGFTSIQTGDAFGKISDFINHGTGLDANDKAGNRAIFNEFLETVKMANCKINHDVLFALIDQQADGTLTRPYPTNLVPGVVHTTHYDMGRQGYAFYENNSDQVIERTAMDAGAYNAGWTGRNDAVDFNKTEGMADVKSNGYNLGWTNAGEWVQYSIKAAKAGQYTIRIRHASEQTATVGINSQNNTELLTKALAPTGGWQTWRTTEMGAIALQEGWNTFRLAFKSGSANINYMEFVLPEASNINPTPKIPQPIAWVNGDTLILNPNREWKQALICNINGTTLAHYDQPTDIAIGQWPKGTYIIKATLSDGQIQTMKLIR
ncbi:MAG: cellulase family glycosylhydrolase [Marinilabiliaceae bacterium]|nr:cellulase family glycosylhydrolase [Marinilabiliaceae bacterium]